MTKLKMLIKKILGKNSVYSAISILRTVRYFKKNCGDIERRRAFAMQRKKGLDTIPIFVISYNRLSYLKAFVERMQQLGKTNIVIIDNASTYPPLLEYYQKIEARGGKVIYLDKNYGHKVFFDLPIFEEYRNSFYILSDPDVIPVEECPTDFVERFFDILKKYPRMKKVGFSLKIDDIPEGTVFRDRVIEWENQFWGFRIKRDECYLAAIDTTFALYAPERLVYDDSDSNNYLYPSLRTDYPYQARHLPWYKMADEITEEDIFYSQTKSSSTGQWNPVSSVMMNSIIR